MKTAGKLFFLTVLTLFALTCISCADKGSDFSFAGETDLVIISSENASEEVLTSVDTLKNTIKEKEGLEKLACASDANDEYRETRETREILVGATNRPESNDAAKDFRYDDFTVSVSGDKLVFAGGSDKAVRCAIDYFISNYDKLVSDGVFSRESSVTEKTDYPYASMTVSGVSAADFTIVYPYGGGMYAEIYSAEKYAANRFREMIIEKTGIEVPVVSDREDSSQYKFIIEDCKEDEMFSYEIKAEKDQLRISAGGAYAYVKAFEEILSLSEGDAIKVPDGFSTGADGVINADSDKNFIYVGQDEIPIDNLSIMGNDISDYAIVYHENGEGYTGYAENEIYAANELQKYIKYATGITLELKTDSSEPQDREILVGTTDREGAEVEKIDRSAYGNEGLLIKTEGERLIIAGGKERGTLYGVYSFLEDYLGVRFFTADCETIYKAEHIDIPAGLYDEHIPQMEFRDVFQNTLMDAETAAKRKINSYYQRQFTFALGDSMSFVFGNFGFVHTMGSLYKLSREDTQPCLSDEEIYQTTLRKARAFLDSYGDSEILAVSQNDNNNCCTCSKCMKVNNEEGSKAGTLVRFINRLANDLSPDYPDIKILTLAYMYSAEAPKTPPEDNVIIQLCSLDACNNHALSDSSCEKNRYFRQQINDWSPLTDNLYVWYYTVEFIGEDKNTPYMNFEALYDTYRMFFDKGVKGVFNEGNMHDTSTEFGALRGYLLSRLMWEEDMTREEYYSYIYEFIDAYYGEASDVIEEYFRLMTDISKGKHFTQYASAAAIIDMDKLYMVSKELRGWWSEIGQLDYKDDNSFSHVKALRDGFKYIVNIAEKMYRQ